MFRFVCQFFSLELDVSLVFIFLVSPAVSRLYGEKGCQRFVREDFLDVGDGVITYC